MRLSWISFLSLTVGATVLSPARVRAEDKVSIQTASPNPPSSDAPKGTTFNGVEVPPMKALSGEKLKEDIKHGYWFIKFYSPYCFHCIEIAPTWQTLYEFYYTSKPLPSSQSSTKDGESSFHLYYNFHFAALDCIAYGSTCETHQINSFPTFILFKDGKKLREFTGEKTLPSLSNFVEEALESIRPGSRPKEGVKLPAVGAKSVNVKAKPDAPAAKDKDAAAGAAAGRRQNAIAQKSSETAAAGASATTPASTASTPEKPTKPAVVPNPHGTSVSLTAESFQDLVTTTQDAWFIKFYAPWCHYCQAMAANWEQLGREMKGKMRIGEVNCDAESRLCKDVRMKGYPTIIFFKGGQRVEYDGLRGLGDLISFANKAIDMGDGVKYVTAAEFKKLEETEEVIFLYLYDHATTSEDFTAIERVRLSLIGHAKLVKSNDTILADRFKITTWPRLLVCRDGRPSYYTALAPRDMRDYRKVIGWMKSVWLPIVPELTASNSREIMDGKYVVLGILNHNRKEELLAAKREIKNAALEWMDKQTQAFQRERQELRDAKKLRIEEAEDRGDQRALRAAKSIRINMEETQRIEVGFAWIDGVFWERWIRTTYGINIADGEKVIINDEDNRRYWDTTISGAAIVPSRTSILETLPKVVSSPPKITPKSTTSRLYRVYFTTKKASRRHPYITFGVLLGLLLSLSLWTRVRARKGRGSGGIIDGSGAGLGMFKLDRKDSLLGSVGLGGQNGKVD